MSKTLQTIFLSFSILFTISIQAQETLLEELFDDSTLGVFTEYSEVGDNQKWIPADFGDRFFAQMNGFDGSVMENVDWLISPGIDMSLYTDEVLTFENATNFSGPDLELLISVDYTGEGYPSVATWTDISSAATWSTGDYEYVPSGDVDLSSYEGTAYFAFKYTSSPELQGRIFQIDDIKVTANTVSNTIDNELASKISTPYVSANNLIFSVSETNADVMISVSSINGQLASNLSNLKVSGDVALSVADLPSGVYVLLVRSEGSMASFKFVK